jgi:ABC-type lipoprotein release transport system permease subunit
MFGLIRIALRNLRRNLRRSLITGAAIAGGLSLLIWTDILQTGSYKNVIERGVSTMAGHVVVQAEGYQAEPDMHLLVEDAAAIEEAVEAAVPGARVSARMTVQGLLQSTHNTSGVALVGVDPTAELEISDWHEKIVEDEDGQTPWLAADDDQGIVLGAKLAETLEVEVGDKVVLAAQGEEDVVNRLFRVRSIFRTGAAEVDGFIAITTLAATQAAIERDDAATMITVHIDDPDNVPAVQAAVTQAMGDRPVEVLPWQEALKALYEYTVLDRNSGRAMFFVMGVIVAMGVLNTVLMSVMERIREFGVMLSLGTKPRQVFSIILLEAALLGFFSAVVGLGLGLAFGAHTVTYGLDYGAFMGGVESMEVAGVPMDTFLYGAWNWAASFTFAGAAWAMTVLASIWPAWQAAKLEPVQAMRHV